MVKAQPQSSNQQPVRVTTVANEIRAFGATIWRIEKLDFGLQIRAELGPTQFRVVVPAPGKKTTATIPHERNSDLYMVTSISGLRDWLQHLHSPLAPNP